MSKKNAFALLMADDNEKKKQRRIPQKESSRFVECPTCNRSFAHSSIQFHVEQCVPSTESVETSSNTQQQEALPEPPNLATFALSNTISLNIVRGSVLDFSCSTGAIVNAANQVCLGGSGVDGAITAAGGINLHRDRMSLPIIQGDNIRCLTGGCVLTGPGDYGKLKVPYVIHAVGPNYNLYSNLEMPDLLLQWAYKNSLKVAASKGITKVGFSLLSAGIYRGDRDVKTVLTIGIKAILEWALKNDGGVVESVTLFGFSKKEQRLLLEICQEHLKVISIDTVHLDTKTVFPKEEPKEKPKKEPKEENKTVPKSNVFQEMMQNSKQFYTQQSKVKRQQWFHLDENGKVQWIRDDSECFSKVNELDIRWSSTAMIHSSTKSESGENGIELHISSSIPSSEYRQLIQRKSKFSVPVLKSILQKGVRRRRPLPSVRVAMELADKSLGDLVRRLPIICLEDSFYHYDFPYMVWLMVAHSKEYVPNRELMQRLMRIVFEIASCPWQDNLIEGKDEGEKTTLSLTDASELGFHTDEDCDLMLRSMLLRRKYGGMAGDLSMMDGFVQLWLQRFEEQTVNIEVIAKCLPKKQNKFVSWKDLSKLLHPVDRSLESVQSLMMNTPLLCLQATDITFAGIDFHCSNVLDGAVTNPDIQSNVQRILEHPVSREELEKVLKTAMWHCSAGLNFRRPIISSKDDTSMENLKLKSVWELVVPIVNPFVEEYVKTKLVRMIIQH